MRPTKITAAILILTAVTLAATTTSPAIPALARKSDHPGTVQPGDWLRVRVSELTAAGTTTGVLVRVGADGTIAVPYLAPINIAGMPASAVSQSLSDSYRKNQVINNANVLIDRLAFTRPGDTVPDKIAAGDLLRIDFWDLAGPGKLTTVITRVGPAGTVDLPYQSDFKIAGMGAEAAHEISDAYKKAMIETNGIVAVTILESAPPDAAHLDLPDAPINPVPDAIKPYFSLPRE